MFHEKEGAVGGAASSDRVSKPAVPNLVTVPVAAERLHMSEPCVRLALRDGRLTGTRVGRRWLVDLDSVRERARRETAKRRQAKR